MGKIIKIETGYVKMVRLGAQPHIAEIAVPCDTKGKTDIKARRLAMQTLLEFHRIAKVG